jgi:hypothetical protein
MADISDSSAVLMLSQATLFPTPVQLKGFSADNIFESDPIENAEFYMGVDGVLSTGFVYVAVPFNITLQADSASNDVFDLIYQTEQQLQQKMSIAMTVTLPSISRTWDCVNGFLRSIPLFPTAAKVLQPRKYGIVWERVSPAVTL